MDLLEFSNIENVRLLDSYDANIGTEGRFHVTLTHLIYTSQDQTREIWILINLISSLDTPILGRSGKSLVITCKDFSVYRFTIENSICCDKLKAMLVNLIDSVDHFTKLPCFLAPYSQDLPQGKGWIAPETRLLSVYQRLGTEESYWSISDINKDHRISDTYPSVLVFPSKVSKATIEACSKFRSRGRLPALTYFHAKSGSGLCRCSQPLTGFSARCSEDIDMLRSIKNAVYNLQCDKLHVVDTRPYINAMTNKAKGKGFESNDHYEMIDFNFFKIENIHVMRSSLEKLLKVCRDMRQSYSQFISGVEKSGWLGHLKIIIKTSYYIAECLEKGENVLVHCSDGWDRTSQVCALVQLILNPYYRTIEGLEELIEKDWLSFGHKFGDRCGQLKQSLSTETSEVAPVFTQFLDCLYQLICVFPDKFQYNERLLRHIQRWSASGEFGTFVGNCEKDRLDLKTMEKTQSAWGFIQMNRYQYLNPYYNDNEVTLDYSLLSRKLTHSDLRVWTSLYCPVEDITGMFTRSINIPDHIYDTLKLNQSISIQNHHLIQQANLYIRALMSNDAGTGSDIADKYKARLDTVIKEYSKEDSILNGINIQLELSPVTLGDESYKLEDEQRYNLEISNSVAITSTNQRSRTHCTGCKQRFAFEVRKNMCYSCGLIFCEHCIRGDIPLPGHGSVSPIDIGSQDSSNNSNSINPQNKQNFLACSKCHQKWFTPLSTNQESSSPFQSIQSSSTNHISEPISSPPTELIVSSDPLMDFVTNNC